MEAPSEEMESGCVYNYVVTAQRPTAVTHTAVGNLTDPQNTDLLVGWDRIPLQILSPLVQEEHSHRTLHSQEGRTAGGILMEMVVTDVCSQSWSVHSTGASQPWWCSVKQYPLQLLTATRGPFKGHTTDSVLILTERMNICIIKFNPFLSRIPSGAELEGNRRLGDSHQWLSASENWQRS